MNGGWTMLKSLLLKPLRVDLHCAGVLEGIVFHARFHAPWTLLSLAPGSGVAACRFRYVDWAFLRCDFRDAGLPRPQGAPGDSVPLDDPGLRLVHCCVRRHSFH